MFAASLKFVAGFLSAISFPRRKEMANHSARDMHSEE
jgi:hypothetical protein